MLSILLLLVLAPRIAMAQHKEPDAPAATPAVRKLLDAAKDLPALDAALDLALKVKDSPGEARVEASRAKALEKAGKKAEALAAWRAAELAWKRAGDGPGQV